MTQQAQKGYIGLGMEGPIATWYAKNTARDVKRFAAAAQSVRQKIAPGARVLEVAPGPGYLAIELAKLGYSVSALEISKSFVRMVQENATKAGVAIDIQHGNASAMPFADNSFDFIICMAAFKNFADPIGALNEFHRVLKPGGQVSIMDLRKDATLDEIAKEVRKMGLSAVNSFMTRFVFRFMLLRRAYTRESLERLAAQSRFKTSTIVNDGVGFDWQFSKSN